MPAGSSRGQSSSSDFEAPASLRRRFELAQTELSIAGREYRLLRPRNLEDLISEEDFAIDERIPYWADVWASAPVLAERIADASGTGKRLLELGCGIGLLALAAAEAGFQVLATDYYAEALEFTEANAERNGIAGIDTRLIDWRKLPADLGTFDVVLAADVLYEQPQAGLVAEVLNQCLESNGWALISDPGRRTAEAFIAECSAQGLTAGRIARVPIMDHGTQLTVSIYDVRRG
jgi:predicted nicotinamide N-methyase